MFCTVMLIICRLLWLESRVRRKSCCLSRLYVSKLKKSKAFLEKDVTNWNMSRIWRELLFDRRSAKIDNETIKMDNVLSFDDAKSWLSL